ncbi:MAG: hypothetical protein M9924_03045 [Rhizobiaceae bacterium]|nr:hypothetical protein [Rhizobiaceae bacterium]
MPSKVGEAIIAFVTTLWLGLLIGVSFLATPVKFRAPTLELPVALDVGRVTFEFFSKVELGLSALLLVCLFVFRPGALRALLGVLLVAIVVAEAFWLLPALVARVSQILSGDTTAPNSYHLWYVIGEAAKAVILLALSVVGLRRLASGHGGN